MKNPIPQASSFPYHKIDFGVPSCQSLNKNLKRKTSVERGAGIAMHYLSGQKRLVLCTFIGTAKHYCNEKIKEKKEN